jgi:Zn-dependent protease with chaperone function
VASVDLSFSRYVAARKGAASAATREAALYAYGGDLRVRSGLAKLRPVTLAVEATVRFWQQVGRGRVLGNAVRVSDRQFPRIHGLVKRAAEALQIPPPTVFVAPQLLGLDIQTFGTTDEASILLATAVMDHFNDPELLFLIGRECGHIQNNHTPYTTALHFLEKSGNQILRWGAQPAIMALRGWARRADVTCDRAGLLCARDLEAAKSALVKLTVGSQRLYSDIDVDEYLRQLEDTRGGGPGRFDELFNARPLLPKRVAALRLFAETTFYRSGSSDHVAGSGLSKEECDAKVGELLAVLK